ncbi:MAG: hypothetical protein WC342_09830 [Methanoregula sp.]|jgi:hypothetical protein
MEINRHLADVHVSFDMLVILFIITPYQCGRVIIDSGGESVCELWTGWYIFSAIFTVITLYTGYRMHQSWKIMVEKLAKIVGLKTSRME